MSRYIQIGQRALRGPDGQFLPACPIYILEEEAEEIGLEYKEEEMVTEGIIPILVLKYKELLEERKLKHWDK